MSLMDNAVDVTNTEGFELEWDSEINQEREPSKYIVFPEGDYPFVVKYFDKGRYNPKDRSKIPPCWKATLHLDVTNEDGETTEVLHNLYLHSTQEWALSAFFLSIGQKKHGEPLRMRWNEVNGARGWLHMKPRPYNGKDYNNVQYFIDSEKAPKKASAQPAPRTFQAGHF